MKTTINRNEDIAKMLRVGKELKNFYRFTAQNPHIDLHDACQIVLERPNASVCFHFEEWNAVGRRVNKGKKGISYQDRYGEKHYVFDSNDTHGNGRYKRLFLPMKRLLVGLDELNGTSIYETSGGDYVKVKIGVEVYLKENGYLSGNGERNELIAEGITYSMYSKTGFPRDNKIRVKGFPYDLSTNAELFKEIYKISNELAEEANESYLLRAEQVKVIDDTEDKNISDEPVIQTTDKQEVEELKEKPKVTPFYQMYLDKEEQYPKAIVAIRLGDFYEVMGENAVVVSDELDLTLTGRDVGLEERVPMCGFPYHVADKYFDVLQSDFDVLVVEREDIFTLKQKHTNDNEEYDYEDEYQDYLNGEYEEIAPQVEQDNNPKTKDKAIRDRKNKPGGQQTLFDLMGGEDNPQTEEEKLTDWALSYGSMYAEGKFRIYDEYLSDPTQKEFATFLKKEYGDYGGHYNGEFEFVHDSKGIGAKRKLNNGEEIAIKQNWNQMAIGIANLIDSDKYFSEIEWQKYRDYKGEKIEQPQEENEHNEQVVEEHFNTNLSGLVDYDNLGGAKTKFRNNIIAINTLKDLERSQKTPTEEDKRKLAKYVGWGGLSYAFDEKNPSWYNEYHELKNTLNAEDYERAKGSVLNAHYTSSEVIKGIYNALSRFGVKGNSKMLEPSLGTGNFFGFMPSEIADSSRLYGVELDSLTGRIAQKLYPQAKIQIKGFEETSFENNSFDVVVGNVPFGGYGVHDSDYNKYNFLIHDYFLAKSIDKLKPNGLMAVITSKGTMDKLNPQVRKYLADRAELVGAIRLPNTAFKKIAGTEVVADILFFCKREEKINADTTNTNWLATSKTEQGFEINNYFVENPQMVLGELVEEHGLYGAIDVTVKSDDRDILTAINDAVEYLPKDFYTSPEYIETEQEEIEADYDIRPLCFKASSGKVYLRVGDSMVEQTVPKYPKDAYLRIEGMIALRSELRHILDSQTSGCSDDELYHKQRKLNVMYDNFVKRYGYLNSQTNTKLFKEDGDSALLFASENLSEDKKTATKADIYSKRTIRPYSVPTATDDCYEALQISKNERGKVDIAYIEELTKKNYDTVLKELSTAIYRNPLEASENDKYAGFETSEEYLSGDVRRKLYIAENAVMQGKVEYKVNVTALQEVQPAPLTASEISVRLGASWVDKSYYGQFLCDMLGVQYYYRDGVEIFYNNHDGSYKVNKTDYVRNSTYMKANEVYGTSRANAFRLFEDCLNLKSTTIYDYVEEDGKEKRVLNNAETIQAREKQNKIKELFKDWIYENPERREELEYKYNQLFNRIRLPLYEGNYLAFPDMNPSITLKPHQKNAIHRIITSGNTLLHHVVGSGKTYTICASIMKLRQYGLAKKPMIAVPNHLVQQWSSEFRNLYPNAKLLIATKDDLDKNNRQKFVSRVAMGDWDAVIIAQSSFAKINISPDRQIKKIREEIANIESSIASQWEDNNFPRGAVKNLERIKKGREATLKKLLDESKKDNLLIFEQLGVDYLFVDEAHYYKNKFLYTKMNNVAGISNTASQRATDLELKVEYINELHGGDKGVVFATGTPISNSMTEMYTMQSYLQKNHLNEIGINYFDSWAGDFGETITSLEMAPSGQGYKPKTRFAKFTNLPELLTLYRTFADVQTSDMVKLDVPEAKRNVINLKPSDIVIDLAEEIAERAEKIAGGGVNPHIDNMLKVTSDGKKLALDPRCFDKGSTDEETSKINSCVSNIYDIWDATKAVKGTQIVFCDLSTPKRAFEDYEYGVHFDVYNDIKHKLVEKGINKEEIAFIHDASTDLQKQALFNNVNSGKIRVLIGSTEKCGAGTNVQKRLVALHHLDTPYRPSDLAQREGRIIRQGNSNETVQIFTYVTERTFDSYSYQILENKQRFISQIDRGDLTIREADDIDETTLSYAEIKAITAANPKIKRKMELDSEVARLRVLEGQYKKNLYSLQDKIRKTFPEKIRKQSLYLERLRQDIDTVKANWSDSEHFSINVNGVIYTDKKEGARQFQEALMNSKENTVVATYCGLKISLNPIVLLTAERNITIAGEGQYIIDVGVSGSGNIQRLDNFMRFFVDREPKAMDKLKQLEQDLITAEEQVKVPFEHKAYLEEISKELVELNAELDLNRREEVVIDETQEDEKAESEEQFMELPQNAKQPQKRKSLNNDTLKAYKAEQQKKPNEIMFVKNGSGYEVVGEKAIDVAFLCGVSSKSDKVLGEDIQVVSFNTDELDKRIGQLIKEGKKVRIVEDLQIKKEDKLLLDIDKEFDKMIDETPDNELEEILEVKLDIPQDKHLYRKLVNASVVKEFHLFKEEMLENSKEDVFKENYKIRFFDEIYNFFNDSEEDTFDDNYMRVLTADDGDIISNMYDYYLDNEYASIANYGDTIELVKGYIEFEKSEELIAIEKMEETMSEKNDQTTVWHKVSVPMEASLGMYEEASLFIMPNDSKYKGQSYYLPNGFIKEDTKSDEEKLLINLPEDFKITVNDRQNKVKTPLSVSEFIDEVKGKTSDSYKSEYRKPSENNEKVDKFSEREKLLRKNIPEEMQVRDNWVIVRTKLNENSGRLSKYLISPVTGKFAEIDNPDTWVNFETACKYARENGGETLAYALDGKDKICCIDVDDCKIGANETSNVPAEIRDRTSTYMEQSISGKGVHFFGKTNGMDLRTFSRDGDMEFYQKSHFIAVTGDSGNVKELANFDTPQMKTYLENKCDKRTIPKGVNAGVEGLSTMTDKDLVDKAISSKGGDTFKALYNGQDLQNNHSNSDMSLMNRLAFWCNGDKEQMLRIFATSGLFRQNKSADYYEGTAVKAIRDTMQRYQPQAQQMQNPTKPINNNNNGGGKR